MTADSVNKYQKRIITIPNMLSFFRVCLIPVIMWLYIYRKNRPLTLLVLLLSGATDILDGTIARKFNMISDFGKAFDPVADKLTQIAVMFCLISRFPYMAVPFALLVIKEFSTGITSLISIKRTSAVKSAVWHGKLTTASVYSMMVIHLIWYDIPRVLSLILVGICMGIMAMSFILYTIQNIKSIKHRSYDE